MTKLIDVEIYKKRSKKRFVINLIGIILTSVLIIAGVVLLLIFSTLEYIPNLIISIVLLVLYVLFIVFYFLNIFPLINHYYKTFKNANNFSLENRRRMVFVKEIDNKDINNVRFRVLQFSYNEGEKTYIDNLFLLDSIEEFELNKEYRLLTYKNIICEYEEL